jgi:hypothetical protein
MSTPNEKFATARAIADGVDAELRAALPSGWRLTHREDEIAWTVGVPPHDEPITRTFDLYLIGASIIVTHGNSDPGLFGPTAFHLWIKKASVVSIDHLDPEERWGGLAPRLRDCFTEIFRTESPNSWGHS